MNFRFHKRHREQGYILLVLLLTVALLSIGLLGMLEKVEFQIKRDREEEFIHRGVEYSRAVRAYVKKFGHYPPSIEALENSDNLRFLRKRYKDPLTGKDFKILYYGDVESLSPPVHAVQDASISTPNPNNPIAQAGNGTPEGSSNSATESTSTNDSSGTQQSDQSASSKDETATPQSPEEAAAAAAQAVADAAAAAESEAAEKFAATRVIVGVTSYSDRETIRVFNKKNHYNQWQFVYDPSTDRGLIKGPNQPFPIGAPHAPTAQNEDAPPPNAGVNLGQK
jgi:type II secretory pathway pseudopilin PulG